MHGGVEGKVQTSEQCFGRRGVDSQQNHAIARCRAAGGRAFFRCVLRGRVGLESVLKIARREFVIGIVAGYADIDPGRQRCLAVKVCLAGRGQQVDLSLGNCQG